MNQDETFLNECAEELRERYGDEAIIVHVGDINIVHLDNPPEEIIHERTEMVVQGLRPVRAAGQTVQATGRSPVQDDEFSWEEDEPQDVVYYPQDADVLSEDDDCL